MVQHQDFRVIDSDALDAAETGIIIDWLWEDYFGRGQLTLLTSQWKSGKTTMLAGLFHRLGAGGEFLSRPCSAAKALIVSEESREDWAERKREIPFGNHVNLMIRPFLTRPTPAQWRKLVDFARDRARNGDLDLFVVDSLVKFLPGRSDSDPATLLEFLDPLRELAAERVAVVVLHHPRREASEDGNTARGSGALLGYVDVILELHRYGKLKCDANRRRLIGLSRHRATPESLIFEWTPGTPTFTFIKDPLALRFQDNLAQVLKLLEAKKSLVTHKELLNDWPPEHPRPSASTLYEWLNRAAVKDLVRRTGHGTRAEPYRFRLKNEDDAYYDRGELPPLKPLPDLWESLRGR